MYIIEIICFRTPYKVHVTRVFNNATILIRVRRLVGSKKLLKKLVIRYTYIINKYKNKQWTTSVKFKPNVESNRLRTTCVLNFGNLTDFLDRRSSFLCQNINVKKFLTQKKKKIIYLCTYIDLLLWCHMAWK